MADRKQPTQLSDIGEFGLIDRLTHGITLKHKSSLMGVGDDAAVIDCGENCRVVTTDMLTEGIHFDLMYTPLKHLGYKAVIVNLSDVYAMNAIPHQITVSIAVSSKFSVEAIEELYSGIHLACEQYNVDLVGGDTVSSLSGLIISVTAIGEAGKEEIKYRSGAQKNDLVCVSGDLGGAFLGLQLLEREKAIYEKDNAIQPDLTGFDYVLERQLKPEARWDIVEWIREEKILVHAMIDISDGLSSEINHICKASGKGCHIYPDKLPVHPDVKEAAKEFNMEYLAPVLHGGEDYELLFTVPMSEFDKISKREDVHIIGNITSEGEKPLLITDDGKTAELVAQGWEGF
ncbi:MAG: thiamine-phosphate kinase [Bacteroidales bacterium]|nr:thiamine-phosphate kinase [Bacteroidales bacterium]